MGERGLVSVIVPVYNVEQYLDQCIESIINQTYSQLEIILVNDGSTDNCEMLCRKWEERDRRIRVISQANQGLAGARNVGVDYCHGEYFVFIDSDDWISDNYVQFLYNAIIREKADIAVCNFYIIVDGEERDYSLRLKAHIVDNRKQKADFLLAGHICMWSKMYKTSFYKGNQITIPRICYEDLAVFPLLVYLSKRIVCIEEALYFYRKNRDGSIMNTNKKAEDFPKALSYSISLVRERFRDVYLDRYILLRQIIDARYMLCSVIERGFSKGQFALLRKNIISVWDEYFEYGRKYLPHRLAAFGSFNTRWILHRILFGSSESLGYYGFTSMISQFMGKKRKENFNHENGFRKKMIKQDWEQIFLEDICKNPPDFLFIDFMEEVKNDIILTEEGQYLTDTEGLHQIKGSEFRTREILSQKDEPFFQIWKQACDKFIDIVDRYYDRKRVVLVKLRYAKYYIENDSKVAFQNQEEIEEKNRNIDWMEGYLQDKCQGIYAIEIPEKYFYSKQERYDKDAYYLNEEVYNFAVQEWVKKMVLN